MLIIEFMQDSLIMGIDPSFNNTGVAIIKCSDQSYYYIYGCCIKTNTKTALSTRLELIYNELQQVLQRYMLGMVAMEGCFVHRNFATAIKLGMVQGIIRLAVQKQNYELREYSPGYIRKMIASRGSLTKMDVAHWMNILLYNFSDVQNNHIIDAAAVALCGARERI